MRGWQNILVKWQNMAKIAEYPLAKFIISGRNVVAIAVLASYGPRRKIDRLDKNGEKLMNG